MGGASVDSNLVARQSNLFNRVASGQYGLCRTNQSDSLFLDSRANEDKHPKQHNWMTSIKDFIFGEKLEDMSPKEAIDEFNKNQGKLGDKKIDVNGYLDNQRAIMRAKYYDTNNKEVELINEASKMKGAPTKEMYDKERELLIERQKQITKNNAYYYGYLGF